jgi:glutamate/tyrosine decarboxylase-like PLP-dependent enzyme
LKAKTGLNPNIIASKKAHYCTWKNAFIVGLDFAYAKTNTKVGMDMSNLLAWFDWLVFWLL